MIFQTFFIILPANVKIFLRRHGKAKIMQKDMGFRPCLFAVLV